MEKDLKVLLEKVVLNDETKEAILEAWNSKVESVREEISSEMRSEFASKFEHDKDVLAEAMEKYINDGIEPHVKELVEQKKELEKETKKAKINAKKVFENFNSFLVKTLHEEIKEFVNERKVIAEKAVKAEKFIIKTLAEEIKEFEESKKHLIEERVALETEKKKQIDEAKQLFIEKAANVTEKFVKEGLTRELSQLKQDLAESRKQFLGKQIFEAFATEYGAYFFSKSKEMQKFADKIDSLTEELNEAKQAVSEKEQKLLESQKEIRITKELAERNQVMSDLLSPLSKEKRSVMRKLLESVDTSKLAKSYETFLPSVVGFTNADTREKLTEKRVLSSSQKEVDGNRKVTETPELSEIAELKRLSKTTF